MSKRNKLNAGLDLYLQFSINGTDLPANTSDEFVAPKDMWIEGIDVITQAAVTTGGTITILTGPAGATTVPFGANGTAYATVPNGSAKGAIVSAETQKKNPNRFVAKGTRIQVKPNNFASAGAVKGVIRYNDSADTDSVIPY